MNGAGRGTLILVVGPSGAGKDSMIAGATARFRGDPRIVFARRLITRPAEAGGENHLPVSPAEFAARRDGGGLMLHWHAHGFDYGLSAELATVLAEGYYVVANVSRTVVTEARRHFSPVTVVAVSAPPKLLAARLAGRGREDPGDIESRLRRGERISSDPADFVIVNDGPLDAAIERFVGLLQSALDQRRNT
jgi:phosphonate metabolism protein PhnN/1,5-bisphosphokinase (PRPP-forming)